MAAAGLGQPGSVTEVRGHNPTTSGTHVSHRVSEASITGAACDPRDSQAFPCLLPTHHQPAPNSLVTLEPAVTAGCAQGRAGAGREHAEDEGRGAEASIKPTDGTREFPTATVQSTAYSVAEFQNVAHTLSLAALQLDYHNGMKPDEAAPERSPDHCIPLPKPSRLPATQGTAQGTAGMWKASRPLRPSAPIP